MTGQLSTGDKTKSTDEARFINAMEVRRKLVYDYLDNWPGTAKFRPPDIHDGIFSYIKRRGKALRPSLLLLCCGAVGGTESHALPAAAAIEVFHTWTLVHDDIIDRDEIRRGHPTVHAEYSDHGRQVFALPSEEAIHYGQAVAILAGDLQQSWVYALLAELPLRGVPADLVLGLIDRMANWLTPELLEGEMLDVQYALTPIDALTEQNVLEMLHKKTGSLLEYAAWCGAKIGLGGKPDPYGWADNLAKFASLSGTAFQLQDDLLGLTADEEVLGKPVGSDLREGKRTLVIYRALARTDDEGRSALLQVLGNPGAERQEVRQAIEVIQESGAVDEVWQSANSLIDQATAVLMALPPSDYRDLLASWAHFLLARSF